MKQRVLRGLVVVLAVAVGYVMSSQGVFASAIEALNTVVVSVQYDLEITEPTFEEYADGSGVFTAKTVCAEGAIGKEIQIAVAFYTEEGRMVDCWLSSYTLDADGTIVVTGAVPDYDKIGAYFFESGTLKPIRPAVIRLLDQQVTDGNVDELLTVLEARLAEQEKAVSLLKQELDAMLNGSSNLLETVEVSQGNPSVLSTTAFWVGGMRYRDTGLYTRANAPYIVCDDYLPVVAGSRYYIYYNGTAGIFNYCCFYDENKEFLSHDTSMTSYITAPAGAAYLRIGISSDITCYGTVTTPVFDDSGVMTSPDQTLIEVFKDASTYPEQVEPVYVQKLVDEIYVNGEYIQEKTVGIDSLADTVEYPCVSLWDPSTVMVGTNNNYSDTYPWGVSATGSKAYMCNTIPVPVSEGEVLTFWYLSEDKTTATAQPIRYVSCYDADKNKLLNYGSGSGSTAYIVEAGVSYIMVSVTATIDAERFYIQRHSSTNFQGYVEPLTPNYKISKTVLPNDLVPTETMHFYLPAEICVPAGYTMEIYNRNVLLEYERYIIQWSSKIGYATERKFVIESTSDMVGESYTVTINALTADMEVVATRSTTVKIVSPDIEESQLIIPIGSSSVNDKHWLTYIHDTLSNGKVSFRGVRGTTDPALVNGITHEGISGSKAGEYLSKEFSSSIPTKGISTMVSSGSYDDLIAYLNEKNGTEYTAVSVNPFWHYDPDNEIDEFDFDWYCNSAADGGAGLWQDSDSSAISITPTGVMIYYGANGLTMDHTDEIANMLALVENIRNSTKGASIPIYVIQFQPRARYLVSYTNDTYVGSTSDYKFFSDVKYITLAEEVEKAFSNIENVYVVPVMATFDTDWNYTMTEVGVNPFNSIASEWKITESTHPTEAGYDQIGMTMYGSICAHYKGE